MAVAYRNIVQVPERGLHYFRHYFIPHEGNEHRPLAIRPGALKVYSVALITVKLALTGFLYAVYPTQGQFAELTVNRIFAMTNDARTAVGAKPLHVNAALTAAAQAKAQHMLTKEYFAHTAPDGKRFWEWIQVAGYEYSTAGENLAMDFTTAESVQNALMASPTHRANIVKPIYQDIGIAVVQGQFQGRQTTILVEEYGAPLKLVAKVDHAAAPVVQQQTVQPPATPRVQGTTAQAPMFAATVTGQSATTIELAPGVSKTESVTFQNTGTTTWSESDTHFIALNATDPAGRTSVFFDSSWIAPYRPTRLHGADVKPGENATLMVTFHAPSTPGTYTEDFALVAENLTWIDGSATRFTIRVKEPTPVAATTLPTAPVSSATPMVPSPHRLAPSAPLVLSSTDQSSDWVGVTVVWSVRFFWAFLIFLTLCLFLHIVSTMRLQHRHVIVQTLVVISLSTAIALIKLHFIEHLTRILIT